MKNASCLIETSSGLFIPATASCLCPHKGGVDLHRQRAKKLPGRQYCNRAIEDHHQPAGRGSSHIASNSRAKSSGTAFSSRTSSLDFTFSRPGDKSLSSTRSSSSDLTGLER